MVHGVWIFNKVLCAKSLDKYFSDQTNTKLCSVFSEAIIRQLQLQNVGEFSLQKQKYSKPDSNPGRFVKNKNKRGMPP